MPPPKTIFINADLLLSNVARIAAAQAAAVEREYPKATYGASARRERLDNAQWVPRDLCRLLDGPLSGSERIRAQQCVRRLEAEGLLLLEPRWVRLTKRGREHVAALEAGGDG